MWAAHAAPLRIEGVDILLRVQREAGLPAAVWRSPFWSGVPMLIGEFAAETWLDSLPLLGLPARSGVRTEGLRALIRRQAFGRLPKTPERGASLRGFRNRWPQPDRHCRSVRPAPA